MLFALVFVATAVPPAGLFLTEKKNAESLDTLQSDTAPSSEKRDSLQPEALTSSRLRPDSLLAIDSLHADKDTLQLPT